MKNFFLISSYLFIMPLITVTLRFISVSFDSVTINFYRFLSGGVFMVFLCLIFFRSGIVSFFRNPRNIFFLALLVISFVVSQFLFIEGMSRTNALTAEIFILLSIPVSIFFAALFFADERAIAKSFRFLSGMLLAILSAVAFAFSYQNNSSEAVGTAYKYGVVLFSVNIIFLSFIWLLVKKITVDNSSFVPASFSALFCGLVYGIIAFCRGNAFEIFSAPYFSVGIVLFSGICGMLAGMGLGFFLVRSIGVSSVNMLGLLFPVVTGIMGLIMLRESISTLQLIASFFIITGCGIAFSARFKIKKKKIELEEAVL